MVMQMVKGTYSPMAVAGWQRDKVKTSVRVDIVVACEGFTGA